MKRIETSKGGFVVLDESELDFKDKKGITYVYNNRHLIDWHNRIKLSEITEDEASSIVDRLNKSERYFLFKSEPQKYYNTARESLIYELESQGIEITQNTYIFKV